MAVSEMSRALLLRPSSGSGGHEQASYVAFHFQSQLSPSVNLTSFKWFWGPACRFNKRKTTW